MSIVRELLTKLSFKVDRSGLDSFEKSIVGFKTKIAAVAASISAAIYKAVNYFTSLAKTITATEDLANNTQTAVKNVVQLQAAFENLGVSAEKFNGYFQHISELLYEARSGRGKLFEIMLESRGKLNLTPFIETNDVRGALLEVLKYVGSLEVGEEKRRAISGILGENDPNALIRLINKGQDTLLQAEKDNERYAETYAKVATNARQLGEAINVLESEFKKLTTELAIVVIPLLTEAARNLRAFLEEVNKKGLVKTAATAAVVGFNDALPIGRVVNNFLSDAYDSTASFFKSAVDFLEPQTIEDRAMVSEMQSQRQVTINNTVDVTVPPGTPEQEAINLAEIARQSMQSFWERNVRELVENNPQVE